ARAHVAARIDHDDVPLLDLVEHMAMELRLRVGVFALAEDVGPLRQELQRQRRADDRLAGALRHRPEHMGIAESHMAECAGNSGGADILQRVDDVLRRTGDARNLGHGADYQLVTEPSRRVRWGASQNRKLSFWMR